MLVRGQRLHEKWSPTGIARGTRGPRRNPPKSVRTIHFRQGLGGYPLRIRLRAEPVAFCGGGGHACASTLLAFLFLEPHASHKVAAAIQGGTHGLLPAGLIQVLS